jgi:CRISPR-associated protein Cas2
MLFYVITYDSPSDRRRKKLSDLLVGYGERVQYSVFECVLTRTKFDELRQRIRKHFKEGEDSIRFYPLSQHTLPQVETWGEPPITQPVQSTII